MTEEEFDKYRFSIKTTVEYPEGYRVKVTEVNFEDRYVGIESGQILFCHEIKKIKTPRPFINEVEI